MNEDIMMLELSMPAGDRTETIHPVILRDEGLKKAWLNPSVPYAELRAAFATPALRICPVAPDAVQPGGPHRMRRQRVLVLRACA